MSGLKTPEPLLRELVAARANLRYAQASHSAGNVRLAKRRLADAESAIEFEWARQAVPEPAVALFNVFRLWPSRRRWQVTDAQMYRAHLRDRLPAPWPQADVAE